MLSKRTFIICLENQVVCIFTLSFNDKIKINYEYYKQ